ncbi:PIR protein [Plasmodium vivax]|nr:PIR protein [Plasmodium vivax]
MTGTTSAEWGEHEADAFSREKQLNSGIFYNILVKVNKLTDYDAYCGTFENPIEHSHVTYVCSIILNYLKNNKVSDNNTDQFSVCKLLNYWAYSKLNDLFPSKGKSEIDNFYKEIEKIWKERINDSSSADYYRKCKPDILLFDYDDWKLRKELYDYYVDILPISISPESYKQDCEQYYKYIKYKKKIYDQYEIFCKNPLDKNCPSFFEKCKKYNPNDILPMLPCYSEMVAKELEQQQASQAARGIRGYEDPSGQLSNTETTNPSTSIGANAGNVFLGVVVTSMTSGALYKFTPLGNMLPNGLGWNNNMRNFNGGDNGLFDYAPETFNPYSGGAEEHYIGYHPA